MAKTKAKELGRVSVLSLPKLPEKNKDEIPHWKVWVWSLRNPGKCAFKKGPQ